MSDGLFRGLTGALFAAIMGGVIGFVFARFYGAGWISGGALGIVIFLIAGLILARTSANLPPPNTLQAPLAPAGGAFRAPPGGAFHAPGAPITEDGSWAAARSSAPAESLADMGHSAGEAVGKAAYSASAAVTSAAQAAKAALSDVFEPSTPAAAPEDRLEPAERVQPTEEVPPTEQVRPEGLAAPREGGPDDLKRIRGVGPRLEEMLNGHGYYHFDQIAAWGPTEIAWVDANIEGFPGRASRDDWVGQAKLLASGGETEFSQRVDKGEVY